MRLHRLSLAHSEELTSHLLEAAIESAPEIELVEIEGDGAFFCAFEGSDPSVAEATLAMHRAFHEKQQEIAANGLPLRGLRTGRVAEAEVRGPRR